jgi:hypothetical protein
LASIPANEKLVTRIAAPRLPFHGAWTYEISPTSTGSRLRITERGDEKNPYSILLHLLLQDRGHPTIITNYLQDLGAKFGALVDVVEE